MAAGATEMIGCTPLPVSGTFTVGELAASLVIAMFAARAPVVVGVKVVWNVTLPPGAMVAGNPGRPASAKSPGLAPLRTMPLTCRLAFPVLVIVTFCAAEVVPTNWLPKLMAPGATEMVGCVPVPLSGTFTVGELAASLVIAMFAARAPTAVGVKVQEKVNEPPGATVAGKPGRPASAKSPGLAPFKTTLLTCRLSVPVLVTVTLCAALVVPTN